MMPSNFHSLLPPWIEIFIISLGFIFGSFFNVCIFRIPYRQSIVQHGSRCPSCASKIRWYHNIPVLSFLWLKGRCASCNEPISIQYPLIEILTAVMFWWLFRRHGLSWEYLGYLIFCSLLVIISVIDLHHRIIPDELSLPGMVIGVAFSFLLKSPAWWSSLLGILIGGGAFLSVAWLYEKLTGKEGLGGGDIKLLAMIGAWLGAESILFVIIVSSSLGTLVGIWVMLLQKKGLKTAIPFGPFLAIAAAIYMEFGNFFLPFNGLRQP